MGSSVEKFQDSQWIKLKELNFSKSTILKLVEVGSVLDIGCGDGILLENLVKAGCKGVGIDISGEAIKICKQRGLNCSQADITERLPFANNSFDSVILTDVLEHLFQPIDVLKEVHRVSKKYVLISVPNFASLPARIQMLFGRVPENNTPRDGHVYWMTHKVISKLLKDSGFEIEKVVVNSVWENKLIIGTFFKWIKNRFPSLFALSFIIKAKKI